MEGKDSHFNIHWSTLHFARWLKHNLVFRVLVLRDVVDLKSKQISELSGKSDLGNMHIKGIGVQKSIGEVSTNMLKIKIYT